MRAEVSLSSADLKRGIKYTKATLLTSQKEVSKLSGTTAIRTLHDSQICLLSPIVCYFLLPQIAWHLTAQRQYL